jgi:hypothetical protein
MASRAGTGVGKPEPTVPAPATSNTQTVSQKANETSVTRSQPQPGASLAVGRKHLPQIPVNSSGSLHVAPPPPMVIDRTAISAAGDACFQPFFSEYTLISE